MALTILKVVCSILCFFVSVLAVSVDLGSVYSVKDYHRAPQGWSMVGAAPKGSILNLSIGLKQARFQELEEALFQVSDPDHPRYGQHLSAAQIHDLIRPADSSIAQIHDWLRKSGIDLAQLDYSPAKDWIRLALPVEKVEELLRTDYFVYEHDDGTQLIRTESWSLPRHLHQHVSTIQPTNSWARLRGQSTQPKVTKRSATHIKVADNLPPPALTPVVTDATIAAVCNFTRINVTCLRTLYGTINYTTQSENTNSMALANFLGEYNNRSDASLFLQKFRPEAAAAAYQFTQVQINNGTIDNGTNTSDEGGAFEGNLDAQYMLGIGWPTPLVTYNTGGLNPEFTPSLSTPEDSDEPFLAWVNHVLEEPSIPPVISTSYGDDEQTISRSYAQAVCNQFAQLGARGVSLLFATGDSGVGENGACISNVDNSTYQFLPSFPASCPYVTTVGATTGFPEVAVFEDLGDGIYYTSGAGFSNYFDQPRYQSKVVNAYVTNLKGQNDGLYNKAGRAYPDISCNGQKYQVYWNGSIYRLGGTSAACPTCAAIFALVNDALIAESRPTLGFLNPWLYRRGYQAFTDVVSGSSSGCNTTGFPAASGWDAVTGFGTPYFPSILTALGIGGSKGWKDWHW